MAQLGPSTPILRRRTASLPVRHSSPPDPQIEILYTLPSARVLSFSTATSGSSPGSDKGSPMVEEDVGNLPWTSRFERTLAVGPLRIYRAPGSVAFLSCNSALRPILPKSQAWCVDDDSSKFVLQIKRPQYWRIEIPHGSSDDKLRSDGLKEVLDKVLMFEKTACPFERSFTVELPKAPETPVKKRPWKPVEWSKSESPLSQKSEATEKAVKVPEANTSAKRSPLKSNVSPFSEKENATPESQHKPPVADSGTQTPPTTDPSLQSFPEELHISESLPAREISPTPASRSVPKALVLETTVDEHFGSQGEPHSILTDDIQVTSRNHLQPEAQEPTIDHQDAPKAPDAVKNCSRSMTAPPILSLAISPPSKHPSESSLRRQTSVESNSSESISGASFYSTRSWDSPLAPPSPPISPTNTNANSFPYPHGDIILPKRPENVRDDSGNTLILGVPQIQVSDSDEQSPSAEATYSPSNPPTLVSDAREKSNEEQAEVVIPPTSRSVVRHRATTSSNSRRRTLSPLPPAVNLFSPPRTRPRHLQTVRHTPTAIIQKTCEILLSPPSHLINLMISIASKIAAGEWRGALSGHGEAVHWDFTEDEYSGEGCHEDDYGISLPGRFSSETKPTNSSNEATMDHGGSWEID